MKHLPQGKKDEAAWLSDVRVAALLQMEHAVAFQWDIQTGRQSCSPTVSDCLAGCYDGRPLFDVLQKDGVICPEDTLSFERLLEAVENGFNSTETLRFLTPDGSYRWFKVVLLQDSVPGQRLIVGLIADAEEEVKRERLLHHCKEYNAVSDIYNRQTFLKRTLAILTACPDISRYLVRFDVVAFNRLNELYGQETGDAVLRYLGTQLRSRLWKNETFAHFDNDVFYMCISRTEQEMLDLLHQLEDSAKNYPLPYQLSLTFGIVAIKHYHGESVSLLCDYALVAQRTVKGNYVRRYAFYEPWMGDNLTREYYITGCMEQALCNHEFYTVLQPKFDMRSNCVVGAEALARWNHPGIGSISPGEFVPIFERNGFVMKMDEYIWEQVCQLLRDWLDRGLPQVPVSVNVSRLHLYDDGFCDKVIGLCEKYRVPPHLLGLEITESACVNASPGVYDVMERLHKAGFTFQIDDFGSGYSSLSSLKDIQADIVKIDLKFLQEARKGNWVRDTILGGVIRLLCALDIPVVVEGVETQEQVKFLLETGCTVAQGYFYAKPMSISKFERLVSCDVKLS